MRIRVPRQTVPWYVTCSTESFSIMPDHQLIPELGYEFLTADQILKLGHKIWPSLSRLLKNKCTYSIIITRAIVLGPFFFSKDERYYHNEMLSLHKNNLPLKQIRTAERNSFFTTTIYPTST